MSGSNGHRAERDGCGCPPWARCVHFDGQVLTLCDEFAAKALHDADCLLQHWPKQYSVAIVGGVSPAQCGCNMECFWNSQGMATFDDLAAAEAEFHRRAEELRASP